MTGHVQPTDSHLLRASGIGQMTEAWENAVAYSGRHRVNPSR
jgi:hypothetical protein